MDKVQEVADDLDLLVCEPLFFREFVQEGAEETSDGVRGAVPELREEAVEIEREVVVRWGRTVWGEVGVLGCGGGRCGVVAGWRERLERWHFGG